MFLSEWREFPSAPCLEWGKKNLTPRVSMLLKSLASLTCFRACFLPGRAKGLSAPRYWPEDGLENTESCNHTRVLMIVLCCCVLTECNYCILRVLLVEPEGRRPLGRPRRRWVDNIRMNLQEVGFGYMDWIGLAQDIDRWRTLVSAVMNLRVP